MTERLGKYRVLGRLATGGMAEILLARQEGIMGFEKLVVLKKILPHLANEKRFMLMFLDEARLAARLNHPHIVQIYELGETEGEYYIAMEYLEGQSLVTVLRHAIATRNLLPLDVVLSIAIQVCEGLDYAHQLQDDRGKPLHLVHRDLSPHNLFVLYSGVTKIVDFGIAQAEERLEKTKTGTIKGKYAYMSPEQVQGRPLDGRSDLFSLGIVLWEALTLRRLFRFENDLQIAQAIAWGEVPPPSALRKDVPGGLDRAILGALAKKSEDRCASAAELQRALVDVARSNGLQTGSVVVAETMRAMFADTIARQRELLLAAREGGLTGSLAGELKPETDESEVLDTAAPETTASPVVQLPVMTPARTGHARRGSRHLAWGLVLILALVGAAVGAWNSGALDRFLQDRPEPGPDAPTVLDAGVGGGADASTVSDAGADEAIASRLDAGTASGSDAVPDGGSGVVPVRKDKGRLLIRSSPPGARLQIDGQALARPTPTRSPGLRPGLHQILATKKGYLPARQEAQVRAERVTTVDLVLQPEAVPTPVVPTTPPPVGTGFLRLDTDPWTEVFLGARKLGPTPLSRVELPAGKHTLRLVNGESGIDRTIEVVIRKGELTKRTVRF